MPINYPQWGSARNPVSSSGSLSSKGRWDTEEGPGAKAAKMVRSPGAHSLQGEFGSTGLVQSG